MLIKANSEEIQDFFSDASYLRGGYAARVAFPETADEVNAILAQATRERTPVTISGAGTGTVAGRVPFGGIVLATDKLNHIKSIVPESFGGRAIVEAGVRLIDLQRAVESEGLMYPPDPTERSCFLGGNVATNASGARTFKYGPTRNYVTRLKLALPTGELVDLRRGELHAVANGQISLPLPSGRVIHAQLPSYQMPQVRKHASGYFVAPGMDVIDLFIGSEGTLGVIVEIEVRLLPKPEGLLSGVVFFDSEDFLLAFVCEARETSLANRLGSSNQGSNLLVSESAALDARALEYFDIESLRFLKQKYETIPINAIGAIFFEQETTTSTEDSLMNDWLGLLERHHALADESWFATNAADQANLREFRHALPVLMNEWFARYRQRKVSTDMAVSPGAVSAIARVFLEGPGGGGLSYTNFRHIRDKHAHRNNLPPKH